MIALLLGIIALVISMMFTTSFDKLANEVRDIRIKYLKIDHILKLLKAKHDLRKDKKIDSSIKKEYIVEEEDEEAYTGEEIQSALQFEDANYYESGNFKENFSENDIVEVFQ